MPHRATSDGSRVSTSDYFRHDGKTGSIVLPDGQRALAFPATLIQGLHITLIEKFGEAAQDILYRTGYEWALQDMLTLSRRFAAEFGAESDLAQMDARFVFERWWSTLQAAGWGACTIDPSALARGIAVIELRNSIVAGTLAGADTPVCHLYAGLFGGALSFYERAERHATELACAAMAGPLCTFVVGPGAEVDSAEAWRQQGTPSADILRRLR